MVHADEKRVIVGAEAEQDAAEQRASGEIKGFAGMLRKRFFELGFGGTSEVDDGQFGACFCCRNLAGFAVDADNAHAQRLLTLLDDGDAVLKRKNIERSAEADGDGNRIERGAGVESIEEPDALLRERKRRRIRRHCVARPLFGRTDVRNHRLIGLRRMKLSGIEEESPSG